ncbi:MAG TPA: nucleotidyltransferase family protein [Novosphingobium sp.]
MIKREARQVARMAGQNGAGCGDGYIHLGLPGLKRISITQEGRAYKLDWEKVALVLLAGGRGTRFGSDKLAAELLGRSLLEHSAAIYAAIPFARRVLVLGPASQRGRDFHLVGYRTVRPAACDLPQSASLRAGVEAAGIDGIDAIMVALADMPLVSASHLEALRGTFDGRGPVASGLDGAAGPPAIFPVAMHRQMIDRTGDKGARGLLAGAPLIAAPREVLADVDTPEDLAGVAEIMALKRRTPGG